MTGEWLELESDPGVFTLLVQELGTKGVQVEEVYDLQKPIEGPVYGFIFLFKWIEERRARRKVQSLSDDAYVTNPVLLRDMFFAHQIVPNSCATHALLSVLLNCQTISLGKTLSNFKDFTKSFTPEDRGEAIGNVPEIARAHNAHAHPEPPRLPEKQTGVITRGGETFHFVSYVPIEGRLYELDGLKPGPLDHGPWSDKEEWTAKFQRVIAERLENEGGSSDIRFSLMAVVADKKHAIEQKLSTLRSNQRILLQTLNKLVESTKRPFVESSTMKPISTDNCTVVDRPSSQATNEKPSITGDTESIVASASCCKSDSLKEDMQGNAVMNTAVEEVTSRKRKKKKKKKKKHSQNDKGSSPNPTYRLPAALDSHNYCKSPLSGDEMSLSSISSESANSDSDEDGTTEKPKVQSPHHDAGENNVNSPDSKEQGHTLQLSMEGVECVDMKVEVDDGIQEGVDQEESSQSIDVVTVTDNEVGIKDDSEDVTKEVTEEDANQIESVRLTEVKAETSAFGTCRPVLSFTAKIPPDLCQPLTIHTTPERSPSSPSSSNYSTDTASEVGSAFNSPLTKSASQSRSNSPTTGKLNRFQTWKAGANVEERSRLEAAIAKIEDERRQAIIDEGGEIGGLDIKRLKSLRKRPGVDFDDADVQAKRQLFNKDGSGGRGTGKREAAVWTKIKRAANKQDDTQHFTPGELLDVLKGVENEISVYEQRLQDEREKRNKYKVDDNRRTHNYDPFIFTFLSMLAEQGKLPALVEKHALIKRRQGISLGRLQRNRKPDRRRRKQRSRGIRKKSGKYK